MFRHGRGRGDRDSMTILAEGSFVDGVLTSERSVRLDGRLEGRIESEGDVIVGPTGVIEADITGVDITICGKVTGNVAAQDRLEMKTGAEVYGDVVYTTIVIEEGVTFEGRCRSHHQAMQAGEEDDLDDDGFDDDLDEDVLEPDSGGDGGGESSPGVGDLGFLADFRSKRGTGDE